MYIDKSTIYFSNGKQFCGQTLVLPDKFYHIIGKSLTNLIT